MLPTWWTSSGTPRTAAYWPTPWPCLTMLPLTWWSLPSLRLSETDGREESKSFPVQALEAVSLYCRGEQGPCPQGGACQHARHGMWFCQGPIPPVVSIPKNSVILNSKSSPGTLGRNMITNGGRQNHPHRGEEDADADQAVRAGAGAVQGEGEKFQLQALLQSCGRNFGR